MYRLFKQMYIGQEYGTEYFYDKTEALTALQERVDFANEGIEGKNNNERRHEKRYACFYHFGKEIPTHTNSEYEPLYEKVVAFFYDNRFNYPVIDFKLILEKIWVK
jgi:hypothetical protein